MELEILVAEMRKADGFTERKMLSKKIISISLSRKLDKAIESDNLDQIEMVCNSFKECGAIYIAA